MSFVRLETWGELNYPDDPPPLTTLRRWARNGNIYPAPELHGRTYRVDPEAFYIKPNKVGLVLAQHHPNGRTGNPPLKTLYGFLDGLFAVEFYQTGTGENSPVEFLAKLRFQPVEGNFFRTVCGLVP